MPTYVFKCDKCETVWEESLKYEDRDSPIEYGCSATSPCDGKISRIPAMPLFAYDNVASKGQAKRPDKEFNNRLKDIKRSHYGSTMNIIE